jgi:hypothetical protein
MVAKRTCVILFSFLLVLTIAGCDMLLPKAKAKPVKKAAVAAVVEPAAVPTPAVVEPAAVKKDAPLPKNVLAKVGTWTISLPEFNERLQGVKQVMKGFDETKLSSKQMVLEELIRQQLLVYEARQQKLDQTKDIQAAVKDFENTLIIQELAGKLTKDIKATEAEAQDFYSKNPFFRRRPRPRTFWSRSCRAGISRSSPRTSPRRSPRPTAATWGF